MGLGDTVVVSLEVEVGCLVSLVLCVGCLRSILFKAYGSVGVLYNCLSSSVCTLRSRIVVRLFVVHFFLIWMVFCNSF